LVGPHSSDHGSLAVAWKVFNEYLLSTVDWILGAVVVVGGRLKGPRYVFSGSISLHGATCASG